MIMVKHVCCRYRDLFEAGYTKRNSRQYMASCLLTHLKNKIHFVRKQVEIPCNKWLFGVSSLLLTESKSALLTVV